MDNCKDAPKLVWLLDIRDETHPVIVATAPLHPNDGELCTRGGRFGAHNLHPNFPGPLYANLQNTTVATWFNGGVRIYRATEGPKGVANVPPQIEELGFYIPAAPAAQSVEDDPDQPRHRRRRRAHLRERPLCRRPLHPALYRVGADGLTTGQPDDRPLQT